VCLCVYVCVRLCVSVVLFLWCACMGDLSSLGHEWFLKARHLAGAQIILYHPVGESARQSVGALGWGR